MNPRDTNKRLEDIYNALGNIYDVRRLLIKYPHEELLPEIVHNSTIYSLIVIGEAIKHLDNNFKASYPQFKWDELIGLRNRLTHQYFNIELEYIETLIDEYLNDFAIELKKLLGD